ncbi:TPA: beta-galactosidase [Streptococcus equi subsp. zooepidemicus]|uniref:glycoside hydrolase family 35 protein n=1 Tax=Streptococcus equi TaxID=1336 RepID=UPI0012B09ACE|nr:beta-galactosidase family protein [Streptococcus equi]MCD3413739.1 beta-galactosidase [Streptococcus equi subsp. zooepidemicus]QGM23299.1 beta-galactosidase [Streptococcus equi subsp. zooepidemicus]HEL0569443.1 beta-galactosidase [Streptococcus equi subsp. zooepidemicus]HEL0621347.1 beta-galactosidase [Streptococcus equi subsp. zooepidemicus]HEL0671945.1 beta-galactosidase [Streptococcus equi subsp. zooepidemicus]
MKQFCVKEQFYLDGKPFKILSGAIHYFRIAPDSWPRVLYQLKALGFNTVETYIPWNMHEPRKGQFTFEGIADVEAFLDLAQEYGLYAIVRPSPYICAEWEFGGLPAWLLTENCRVRSSDEVFLKHVADYYDVLLPKLVKRQLDNGGNILMFQLENEYGSYGEEKDYLRKLKELMLAKGISAPLFTSDGPWLATLASGSLIDDDVFVTGNFGSNASKQFASMQDFFQAHQKQWPLMCMEFWLGWFNRWNEPIIRRDPKETVDAIMEAIELGSINLYMFCGGTNFGFMNGSSARLQKDLPQITSYDYDALLDEAGNPTKKYILLQERLKERYPQLSFAEPMTSPTMALESIRLSAKVSLFKTIKNVSAIKKSFYPCNMEELGQPTGYLLYRTHLARHSKEERLRVIDARDRIQLFLDEKHVKTQYQEEIGQDILIHQEGETTQLDILVENMGRVSYGHKLTAPSQQKGLGRGLMADLHFVGDWEHFPLDFQELDWIDFSAGWTDGVPGFYAYDFDCQQPADTYLDLSQFGKGVALVNGVNLGRFWKVGPTLSLYIPKGLLKQGQNRLLIFETEGQFSESIRLTKEPIYNDIKGENL